MSDLTVLRDEIPTRIEYVVYAAITHGLIATGYMLPAPVRQHLRDEVIDAITPWLDRVPGHSAG